MPHLETRPSMSPAVLSTLGAAASLVAALLTGLGDPPFLCALVLILVVPVMVLCAVAGWVVYFRQYVEYRIAQVKRPGESQGGPLG